MGERGARREGPLYGKLRAGYYGRENVEKKEKFIKDRLEKLSKKKICAGERFNPTQHEGEGEPKKVKRPVLYIEV